MTVSLAVSLALAGCSDSDDEVDSPTESEAELVLRAQGIHERVITIDTHDDISASNFTAESNYSMDLSTQVTLGNMEEGGLDVAWFVAYVGQGELDEEGYAAANAEAIAKFEGIHRLVEEYAPERIELALTSDDVRRISESGKKVAMIGVENSYQLGLDLNNIEDFYNRGARYMSLTHNGHNQFGDSHTGEAEEDFVNDGLSALGVQAIDEMNRLGIIVDISHPGKQTNLQAIEQSRAPVIASHSAARALVDISRNIDDEQLLAMAAKGGVVQTVAFRSYLDADKNTAWQEASQVVLAEVAEQEGFEIKPWSEVFAGTPEEISAYRDGYAALQETAAPRIAAEVNPITPPVDVADLIDHVDYMVELIGVEHVGISSDFEGGGGVEGWNNAAETFNVTLELVRRGYTEDEIGMIWGGNLLRVLDEAQAVAAQIQAEV
ncbi:dipeptidase [Granulosicoccus antarcticus]|nr:membrane dipeptidase [Granulosicoccus antarcticus]